MIERKRKDYITVLNVFAAFAVVILHCNGCFWDGPSQGRSWITANLIESLLYWPVPIFFMIPGVTLLDYRSRMDTREYIMKRVSKTVIPFLLWSLFALMWVSLVPWRTNRPEISLLAIVDGVLNAKYVSIYWFFPALFALYASIPVISIIRKREEAFIYLAVVGILFVSLIPFIFKVLGVTWNADLIPPVIGGFALYLILGWLLDHEELPVYQRRTIYILGVLGFLAHALGTHYLSVQTGQVSKLFKGYLTFTTVIQACAVFLWFRSVDWERGGVASSIARFARRLQPYSFGVYLIHWYLIDIATMGLGINRRMLVWRTVGALVIFAVSIGLTWLIQKIPLLRKTVPR